MKNLITIAITFIALFSLSGCGAKTVNGLSVNKNSILDNNSEVKVYYKDLNHEIITDSYKAFIDDFNASSIIPKKWLSVSNPGSASDFKNAKFISEDNVSKKKVENFNLSLSKDGTKIIFSSNAKSTVEFLEDYQNFFAFVAESLNNTSIKDKYLTSRYYFVSANISEKWVELESKHSYLFNLVKNDIEEQIKLGGWHIVNKPEDADKEIYFELSRDYFPSEINELKKQKKGIKLISLEAGNKFNVASSSYNNSSHIVVGQSAMNLASNSNGNLASAIIGVSVSAVFSMFGNNSPKQQLSGSFVSLRILDKAEKKEHIKLYDTFMPYYDDKIKKDILPKINTSVNIKSNSNMFDIN